MRGWGYRFGDHEVGLDDLVELVWTPLLPEGTASVVARQGVSFDLALSLIHI